MCMCVVPEKQCKKEETESIGVSHTPFQCDYSLNVIGTCGESIKVIEEKYNQQLWHQRTNDIITIETRCKLTQSLY